MDKSFCEDVCFHRDSEGRGKGACASSAFSARGAVDERVLEQDTVLGGPAAFFFETEQGFFRAEELDGGGRQHREVVQAASIGDKTGTNKRAGEGRQVRGGGVHVCVNLSLETVDFGVDGGEDGGEGLSFTFGVGELAPTGESFREEVGGLDEVVEGVDLLDDAEVWAAELRGDLLFGEVEGGVSEEACGDAVGGGVWGVAEDGVGGVVMAEGFEAFFVDEEVRVVVCEGVFFGQDAVGVDVVEAVGDVGGSGREEDVLGDGVVVEEEGAEPGGGEGVRHGWWVG